MAIFKNLAGALNKPLAMSPPMRSALVQYLLQQSGSPQGVVSPYGTANKALQGLLMRKAAIADRQQNEQTQDRQQGLAGALSRTNQGGAQGEAARRAAMIIAGGLPDDPVAQQLLHGQARQITGGTGGQDPAKVAEYQFARQSGYQGSFEEFLNQFYGREQNAPSALLEWNEFQKLSPEDRAAYIEMKRTTPIERINQVPTRVLAGGVQDPLSTVQSEAQAAATVARAEGSARATGQSQAEAAARLPSDINTANQALQTVRQLRDHPGRSIATGASRMLQAQMIPGTAAYDFDVLRKQAQGQLFLTAYQSLKGGGTITEVEGQKAEQSIARMDAAQSEAEFLEALNEYEGVIKRGLDAARVKAGAAPAQSSGGIPDVTTMSDEELRRLAGGQ